MKSNDSVDSPNLVSSNQDSPKQDSPKQDSPIDNDRNSSLKSNSPSHPISNLDHQSSISNNSTKTDDNESTSTHTNKEEQNSQSKENSSVADASEHILQKLSRRQSSSNSSKLSN